MNQTGLQSGNASITAGRDLPWLQDTASANVWGAWNVTYRDVVVLDADNVVYYVRLPKPGTGPLASCANTYWDDHLGTEPGESVYQGEGL